MSLLGVHRVRQLWHGIGLMTFKMERVRKIILPRLLSISGLPDMIPPTWQYGVNTKYFGVCMAHKKWLLILLHSPPLPGTFPNSGPESRPRLRKKHFNNHVKRGCQCHFIARRLKEDPTMCPITYTKSNR